MKKSIYFLGLLALLASSCDGLPNQASVTSSNLVDSLSTIESADDSKGSDLELLSFESVDESTVNASKLLKKNRDLESDRIIVGESGKIWLKVTVKNMRRASFVDLVLFVSAVNTLVVYNEGNGDYQCSSTTIFSNNLWITEIYLEYSVLDVNGLLEVREITFLSPNKSNSSARIPDNSSKMVKYHKHAFSEWTVETNAGDYTAGLEYQTCIDCGYRVDRTLPAKVENAASFLNYYLLEDGSGYSFSLKWENMQSLTELIVPESYNGLPVKGGGFANFMALQRVVIPSTFEKLGDRAFYITPSLKEIVFPETILSIGAFSFVQCGIENLYLPDSLIHIDEYAFYSGREGLPRNLVLNEYDNALYVGSKTNPFFCLLKAKNTEISSCIIHPNCKFILLPGFQGCTNLFSIEIPEGVLEVGKHAFDGSGVCRMSKEQKIDAVMAALTKPEAALGNLHMKNVKKQISINDQGEEDPDHAYITVKEADIADNKAKLTLTQAMPISGAEFVAEASSLFKSITTATPIADAVALFNEEAAKDDANPMIKGYTAEIDGENVNVFTAPKTSYRVVTETDYINIGIPSGKTNWNQQSYSLAYLAKKDEQDIGLIPNISPLRLARHADEIKAQALSLDEASGKLTVDLTKVGKLLDSPIEGSATVEFSPASILNIAADVVVDNGYSKYHVISTWEFSNFGQVSVTLPDASEIETCDHETTRMSKLDDEEHYTYCENCNSVIGVEPHSFDNDLCYVCYNSVYEEIDYPVSLGENLEVTVTLRKGSNTHVFDQSNLEVHYKDVLLPHQGSGSGDHTYDLQVEYCDVGEEGRLFIRLYREYALAEGDDPCLYDAADTVEYYFYSKDEEKEGLSKLEDALMQKTVPAEAHYTKKGQIAVGQGQVHRHKEHSSSTKIEGDLYHVEVTCEVCGKMIESYDAELK